MVRSETDSHRWHPDMSPKVPIYLKHPFIAEYKRAYVSTLGDIANLLDDVDPLSGLNALVLIPGVGGSQEPLFLADKYDKHVISLDRSQAVIQKHQRDKIRIGKDYEALVLGDASHMPFADGVAKLISFSSVMHEIVSEGLIDKSDLTGVTAIRKDEIVKKQIDELKRLTAPGGVLAIQDVLPQPFGRGKLRLETKIAEEFFEVFLSHHSFKHFDQLDKYILGDDGDKIEVIGSDVNLSEIWWHFRWWWVDQIRHNAPHRLVDPFLTKTLGRTPTRSEATYLRLNRNNELLPSFDRLLEQCAKDRFKVQDPLSNFREWAEIYNISEGIRETEDYITYLFSDDTRKQEWYVMAYVIEDDRDNFLLNRHFSLFDESGENRFDINPKRMIIFAVRLTGNKKTDTPKLEKILRVADKNVGQERRVLPKIESELVNAVDQG